MAFCQHKCFERSYLTHGKYISSPAGKERGEKKKKHDAAALSLPAAAALRSLQASSPGRCSEQGHHHTAPQGHPTPSSFALPSPHGSSLKAGTAKEVLVCKSRMLNLRSRLLGAAMRLEHHFVKERWKAPSREPKPPRESARLHPELYLLMLLFF